MEGESGERREGRDTNERPEGEARKGEGRESEEGGGGESVV